MTDRFKAQVKEVVNRNVVVSLLLAKGYNVFLPVYDGGIDFIIHRETDGETRKVQLKSRWTISRRYVDRDIWVAFPSRGDWYLAPHDVMLEFSHETVAGTRSWAEGGEYSRRHLSKTDTLKYEGFRLASIESVAEAAAELP